MELPQTARRGQVNAFAQPGSLAVAIFGLLLFAAAAYGIHRWRTVHQSPIEAMLAKAIKRAGLPDPVAQHHVRARGRLVTIPDFAYPDRKVCVFCDGWKYHGTLDAAMGDARKRNYLSRTGWIVLVFHGRTLYRDMPYCVGEIEAALAARAGHLFQGQGET
jgi:very-short-patch-repair endonuclease